MGKPKLEISESIRAQFVALVSEGLPYQKAAQATRISLSTWQRLRKSDALFESQIKQADECAGEAAVLMMQCARKMIAAGNPYGFRFALKNLETGLIEPGEKDSVTASPQLAEVAKPENQASPNVSQLNREQSEEEFVLTCRSIYRQRILHGLKTERGMALIGLMKAFESTYGSARVKKDKVEIMFEALPEESESADKVLA